jgi:hypothetical protein
MAALDTLRISERAPVVRAPVVVHELHLAALQPELDCQVGLLQYLLKQIERLHELGVHLLPGRGIPTPYQAGHQVEHAASRPAGEHGGGQHRWRPGRVLGLAVEQHRVVQAREKTGDAAAIRACTSGRLQNLLIPSDTTDRRHSRPT